MLSDKNKALLDTMERKYSIMLDAISDIAKFGMNNTQEQIEIEKYIHVQQQAIHDAAKKLSCNGRGAGDISWTNE